MPARNNSAAWRRQLGEERTLPHQGADTGNVVDWHVFRRRDQVLVFARPILLESDEHLVGGRTADSIGPLWWVGVRVDSLEDWGNRRSILKIDAFDPEPRLADALSPQRQSMAYSCSSAWAP